MKKHVKLINSDLNSDGHTVRNAKGSSCASTSSYSQLNKAAVEERALSQTPQVTVMHKEPGCGRVQ